MGDILNAITGTSGSTEQTTTPDETQQAINRERLNELLGLFAQYDPVTGEPQRNRSDVLGGYEQENTYLSNLTDFGQEVYDRARAEDSLTMEDYYNFFNENVRGAYDETASYLERLYNDALARSSDTKHEYVGKAESDRQRAIDLGLSETGGYVDQVARSRINQALALQGLESSGATAQAIANATAEYGLDYLAEIEKTYGTNVANIYATLMSEQSDLAQNYSGNRTSLSNTYTTAAESFNESLDDAQQNIWENYEIQSNIADRPRQLAENDYRRRQDFVTSIFTGIPFSSGSSTSQRSGTGDIFENMGDMFASMLSGGGT
jgi:hypothetical protein